MDELMVAGAVTVKRRWMVAVALLLAAITLGLYVPILGGQFVYDDTVQIESDEYVHDLSHLKDVVTLRVLGQDVLDNNRPLVLLSYMLDSAAWHRNPWGYHLTNNLLHAGSVVMLFWFLWRLLGSLPSPAGPRAGWMALAGAAVGALVFALHPAHSEAVCGITFREDLLAAFFIIAALLLATFIGPRSVGWNVLLGAAAVFCLFLAVAGKESGAAGPPILFLYWFLFRRPKRQSQAPAADRPSQRFWLAVIAAAFVVVGAFLAARFLMEPKNSVVFYEKPNYLGGSLGATLRIQPILWFYYVTTVFWPAELCADYSQAMMQWLDLTMALVGLAVVAGATVLLGWRNRLIWLATGVFWLGLLPVSNLVPIFNPLADRYMVLPMVGVSLAAAAMVWQMRALRARWLCGACVLAVGAMIAWSAVTLQRERVWHDSLALWSDTAQKDSYAARPANGLGLAYFDAGDFPRAVQWWQRAVKLAPRWADSWANLAMGLDALGRPAEADRALREAVRLDPHYGDIDSLLRAMRWDKKHALPLERIIRRNAFGAASTATTPKGRP
jgi:hypothetical protein